MNIESYFESKVAQYAPRIHREFVPEQQVAKSLPDKLREQVRLTPDSTAVLCDDNFLTYRELALRSSNVARYLHTWVLAVMSAWVFTPTHRLIR